MIHDWSVPSNQHKLTSDQIVGTINENLQTKQFIPKSYTLYNNSKHYNTPYNKSVNAITNNGYPITVDMDILNAANNVLQQNPSKVDHDCMTYLTTNPEHTC